MSQKRILLTGASSGIGHACGEMLVASGAEVVSLDIKDAPPGVATHIHCDMADPASIDTALARVAGRFDALLNVAGVPGTQDPLLIMKVNILGLRHLSQAMLDRMNPGGAIVNIASVAGFNWQRRYVQLQELLATPDFTAGVRWCEAHPLDGNDAYHFSKEAVVVYTMQLAGPALARGLRCNSVSPGPVDTPLLPDFKTQAGPGQIDWVIEKIGRAASPRDIANVVLFLATGPSEFVNGRDLVVDRGLYAGLTAGWIDKHESPLLKRRKV
jgi:NAD(P)-dependent dehydrogenase (short-subunit alcohol dehydrogenase family)